MNGTLAVWIPPWYCHGGDQHLPIRSCVNLTKLEHIGSEYPRRFSEPSCQLEPFPVEDGYRSVEICRSTQLLVNLSSPDSAFRFYFRALNSSDFSCTRHIFLLKSSWMNSNVCLLALKKMSLNSATPVHVHSILNRYHGLIGPIYVIEGSTYQYIVRRVRIMASGLFLIQLSFCAVFFPKDVPTCFKFPLLQSVLSELEGRPSYLCVAGQSFSTSRNQTHCSAWSGPFPEDPFRPCATNF